MPTLNIALKTIRLFFRNYMILPILIGMPIFQIYLLSVVVGAPKSASEGYVQLVLLQTLRPIEPAQFFAASMFVMFLLITGMIATMGLVEEREAHTLSRTITTPIKKSQLILGNLLGQFVITSVIALAIMVITNLLFGIYWGDSWLHLLLVTLCLMVVAISMGFVFAGLFRDTKTAAGAMSFLIIVMSFLSDSLTGGNLTGSGQFSLTRDFTINKWAYEAYIAVMEGQTLRAILPNLGILLAIGTAFTLLAIILFRRESSYE